MDNKRIQANMIFLLVAAIWGFAFVAQRVGAGYVGAFTFNGTRFFLGALSLLPLLYMNRGSHKSIDAPNIKTIIAGAVTGGVLFLAASLQQIGLSDTTAGKAGFITGLYIVLVPIFGILLKHRINLNMWLGAAVAIAGLYLLSVTGDFTISKGDLYELAGAVFWAVHILVIDHYTKSIDALKLSFVQFMTCSVLSLAIAFLFETVTMEGFRLAIVPILYGGICSVGIAYTLQVFGQKYAKPSHAAIVLSMETVFASLGGFLLLNEIMGMRGYTGCALMLTGMIISQLRFNGSKTDSDPAIK
ncbi:MAG TPA: DMT family transporter [Spirochaetota bacterium]|nr:DMT family transporter [Spirochaetota bacterium]HPJ44235.1 DMT family transporter [Spirochaetota bacterium]HPR39380.1 DMT family transporter [Spirochaetota bacterium]